MFEVSISYYVSNFQDTCYTNQTFPQITFKAITYLKSILYINRFFHIYLLLQ